MFKDGNIEVIGVYNNEPFIKLNNETMMLLVLYNLVTLQRLQLHIRKCNIVSNIY